VGVALWGALQLVRPTETTREIRLALVQPSIPQRLIWDPNETTNRFNRLMELSALALATRPDALVWPEASLPDLDETQFQALTNLVASHGAWLIFGAGDAEQRPDGAYDAYNSAFLFDPEGRYVETYRKQRLVIFGEYVPLERWVPWARHLTPIEGGLTEGLGPVPFRLSAPRATLSVLICFEDVFARGARRHVADDTDFLLNLTNDGWFGEGAAQWQHAVHAAFRAVENGVPLVRCTNNGLTCWVDEHGRIREGIGLPGGNIYGAGFIHVHVPLPGEGARWRPTFYRRHGDVFGWGCCVLCGLGLAGVAWHRRESRVPVPPCLPPGGGGVSVPS
jgi:apolipoprotein N-acyltransferase